MSRCKHQWTERTDVLRDVFAGERPRTVNRFWVCHRCLRIEEVRPEPRVRERVRHEDPADVA